MKKIFYGAFIGLVLVIVMMIAGSSTNGAPAVIYVYSDSMVPAIQINDAFIIWPSSGYRVDDIIMYRPVVMDAPYITHRIIAMGENGYITKGDNSPSVDQDAGEPEVAKERIAGKVLTIRGKPIRIQGLGKLASKLQTSLGGYARILSGAFFALSIIIAIPGGWKQSRKRKSRRRLRLRHIYRIIVWITVGILVFSIYIGSRITQIKYLVSEYPGTLGDQVEVGKPGQLTLKMTNSGILPVWNISETIEPFKVYQSPEYLAPRSQKTIVLDVPAQRKTGNYLGYIKTYHYPVLLPRAWIVFFHNIHPLLGLVVVGGAVCFWFLLIYWILGRIPGFAGWIPLKAMKDKAAGRRLRRARAKILGRRRLRIK